MLLLPASLAIPKATADDVVLASLELVLEQVRPSLEVISPSETKFVGELEYFAQGGMRHIHDTVEEEA